MIVVFRKFRKLDFLFLSLNFERMIDIRDISGRIKLSVSIGSGSLHRFELMKEDYISIVFSLEIPVQLEIGDNVDYEGSFYYVTDKVYPAFNTSNGGYDYTLRLESHYYRWKNHILFYDRQGNKEASWSLTRSPEAHLSIVVSNLRAIGFTFNGKEYQAIVDSSVDPVAKLVQYDNTNIIDALTKIAEAWECEWWVDGDKIYLGHLEHGEPVNLEIGKEISSMSRSQSQDIFATRLYAFGSTRNIPSDYRKGETGAVVEGVIQKRLMLPAGTPYVDVIEGLEEEQVVEAVVIFDDIYPRVTGTITEVTSKDVTDEDDSGNPITFTVYRFKDANLTFKEEYILPGQDLHVIFQTGPLSGMDFALEFNPERLPEDNPEAQVFEIVRNDTYGQTLPESPLIPGTENKYILYNFDTRYVNDALIPQAEQELLERTIAYKDKVVSDPSTYTCSLNSYRASGYDENNGLLNPKKEINLLPGQRVNLINKAYFKNGRISRVIGFEKKLDIPYDSPVYTIGESAAYSRLGELEQKLDNIQFKGNTYVNQGGGFGVYIVKKDDTTAASDENVFSALRTLYEINKAYVDISDMYLRKDIPDTAHEDILFDKKIGSSIFIDGWEGKGWEIQSTGAALLDSLRVRSDIYVGGHVGSPSFISGFPEGLGWDLSPYTRTNAAGIKETRYRLEIDDIVARKSARFYEMIISQLRGENDNVMFSGQMKVAYYDPGNGRLYLDTELGILYNPFRPGDLLEVQRYNGMPSSDNDYYITKQYELQVEEVGIGSLADGEDRLDWITFKNFVGNLSQIAEGDVLTRIDSATDSTRKGVVKITTIDELGTPHISAIYGMKTNPDDSLLARLGNCAGVRTKKGTQLTEQVGLYARGAFFENSTIVLQNGDTLEQTFIAMNGKFESLIEGVRNDMSSESGNILVNSSFSQNTNYWTAANTVHFINVGGRYLWMDSNFYVEKDRVADIYNDDGRNVLRIRNTYILQQNGIMNIPEHTEAEEKTYSFSLYYKVLRAGSCGFGIPGTPLYLEQQLPESDSYQKLSKVGKWDGKGDFELRFTGEILIYGVSLFNDALADAQIKLQTQIDQTKEYIKLLATKEYVDEETEKVYTKYQSDLSITAEQIRGDVRQEINGVITSIAQLTTKYNEISASVSENEQDISNVRSLANSAASQAATALTCGMYGQEQYSQTTNPWNGWPSGTEYKHVGALWYNPNTGVTQRYVGTGGGNNWETVSSSAVTAASYVLQNKDKWSMVVANFDSNGNPTESSGIVTTAYGNSLWVKSQDYTGNNIASLINQSSTTILLKASKIELEGVISANGTFKIDTLGNMIATGGKIGRFSIINNRLVWNQSDYFGGISRSLKLGYSTGDEGVVDVSFDAATDGRFGIKAVGRSPGSAAIYGSSKTSQSYPTGDTVWAGWFDGYIYSDGYFTKTPKGNIRGGLKGAYRIDNSDTWFVFDNGIAVACTKPRSVDLNTDNF